MYELKISVKKVLGTCTANPPMKQGDYIIVSDGDIRIPEGGYICLWALQSMIPLITLNEREISEQKDRDWMQRVNHAQCPDPNGRVLFKIERKEKLGEKIPDGKMNEIYPHAAEHTDIGPPDESLYDLNIEVETAKGKCHSKMKPGDRFMLRSGRLYIPPGRNLCFCALQAITPFLPAKQRVLHDGDWMKEDTRVICPDPAGNVVIRIDRKEPGK